MVRSSAARNSAVRGTLRRAAALAATGTLAVLATAGPALAQSAPAPRTGAAAVSGVAAAHDAQSQPVSMPQALPPKIDTPQTPPPGDGEPCEHHHGGLLSSLLAGVGDLLGKLLGVLL